MAARVIRSRKEITESEFVRLFGHLRTKQHFHTIKDSIKNPGCREFSLSFKPITYVVELGK